jgi:starvation-inducible outer membrane lipoprotein
MKIILLALLLAGCATYPNMSSEESQRELDIFMAELRVQLRTVDLNLLRKRVDVGSKLAP